MTYEIRNTWNDKTWCPLSQSWVNDGRESTKFENIRDAKLAEHVVKLQEEEALELHGPLSIYVC